MTGRVVLGGILGGIVVFVWGAIHHMVLPFGTMGMRDLPDPEPILSAMKANVPEDGLYFFPGMSGEGEAAQEEWMKKIEEGPTGLLVYHRKGSPMSPAMLAREAGSNVACALLASILLGAVSTRRYWARVGIVAALGVFASLSVDFSYWNWYGFPTEYWLAQLVEQVVGFALAGLVLARLVPPAGGAQ